MTPKEILGIIAIAVNLAAYFPYLASVSRGRTKPHLFSWIIWGTTTCIVFLAQWQGHGGAGAWAAGVSGLINFYVAFMAWRHKGDTHISRTDWVFFASALASLPFWYFTSNPLWAVVVLTAVDVLGFGPTATKVYHQPHEEKMSFFLLFMVSNAVVLGAMEVYSWTTVLFPAIMVMACFLLVLWIAYRRRAIRSRPA